MSKILIVGAHPDDEILGVGGTWHRHLEAKDEVQVLIFSSGRKSSLDQHFETVPITSFIKQVEKRIISFNPEIVYTHSFNDINKDHQIVNEAVKVACRPTRSNVKRLYAFNTTLSSFDTFRPTHFVTLNQKDIDWKIRKMMVLYPKEMDLSYRSVDGIITQAKFWGIKIGVEYAEAFETVIDVT